MRPILAQRHSDSLDGGGLQLAEAHSVSVMRFISPPCAGGSEWEGSSCAPWVSFLVGNSVDCERESSRFDGHILQHSRLPGHTEPAASLRQIQQAIGLDTQLCRQPSFQLCLAELALCGFFDHPPLPAGFVAFAKYWNIWCIRT